MLMNVFQNKIQEEPKILNKIRNHKILVTAIGAACVAILTLISISAYIAVGWIV